MLALLGAFARDPRVTCRLILGLIGLGDKGVERPFAFLVATDAARHDRVWLDRAAVRACRPAAPLLKRRVLIPIDRAARGTPLLGVRHAHARVIPRPRPPDGIASRVAATDDRLTPIIGLLEHRHIRTAANRSRDPRAPVIDDLGADRARRQQAADNATILIHPRLRRTKSVLLKQARPTAGIHLICDKQVTVFETDHPSSRWERYQDCAHEDQSERSPSLEPELPLLPVSPISLGSGSGARVTLSPVARRARSRRARGLGALPRPCRGR